MKIYLHPLFAILISLSLVSCSSTGSVEIGSELEPAVDTTVDAGPVEVSAAPVDISADAVVTPPKGLPELTSDWNATRTAATFVALGEEFVRTGMSKKDDLRYAVLKHLGRPDSSSLLSQPSFVAYKLQDGRTAQVSFPGGNAAMWEVLGSLSAP